MSVRIRRAGITDAPAVAEIYVETWREAYPGMLPDRVSARHVARAPAARVAALYLRSGAERAAGRGNAAEHRRVRQLRSDAPAIAAVLRRDLHALCVAGPSAPRSGRLLLAALLRELSRQGTGRRWCGRWPTTRRASSTSDGRRAGGREHESSGGAACASADTGGAIWNCGWRRAIRRRASACSNARRGDRRPLACRSSDATACFKEPRLTGLCIRMQPLWRASRSLAGIGVAGQDDARAPFARHAGRSRGSPQLRCSRPAAGNR